MRKTRTISLRVTEQQFEALKSLYAAHGAKSISDFARTAMQNLILEPTVEPSSLELKVQEIDGKVQILSSEVARFSQLLEKALGTERHD